MIQVRKEIIRKVGHYTTAFVILMEAVIKAEDFSHNWPYVVLFFAIGTSILVFTVYERRIEKMWIEVPPIIQLLESAVLFLVGYSYLQHNKKYIQWVVLLAALLSLVSGGVRLWKIKNSRKSVPANKEE